MRGPKIKILEMLSCSSSESCLARRLAEKVAEAAGSTPQAPASTVVSPAAHDPVPGYMLAVVGAVYALFFLVLIAHFCTSRRRINEPQHQDLDLEANTSSAFPTAFQTTQSGKPPVAALDEQWRKAFVRKVYSILGTQIFATVAISAIMMMYGGKDLVLWIGKEGQWTYYTSLFGSIATLFILGCYSQTSPHNMVLLSIFTMLESYTIGAVCTMYYATGSGILVLEAFAITSVVFVGLTLFTMQSKINFDFLGPGLFAGLLVLITWGFFVNFFFDSFVTQQLYALGGTVLFSLFIVYDTHMIMKRLSYDDYISGSISLYLDFLNMFLFILRLLGMGGSDD